tara:strand:+ start:512 stop:1540 length:1029 start_codon:yes stop_codon:yes gene_type:complete
MKLIKKILSLFYLSLFLLHKKIYKYKSISTSNAFVISVGNLTFGGSGKTPMIEKLSSLLIKNKISHVVLSRGYKKKSTSNVLVSDGKTIFSNPDLCGDEPYMLAQSLPSIPIMVGNKKEILQDSFKTFRPSAVLIDDAFQSLNIKKNLEILLIDTSVHIKEYALLPLGRLRVPLSEIKRSHIIIFTKCNHNIGFKDQIIQLIKKHTTNQLLLQSDYVLKLKKYKRSNNSIVSCNQKILLPAIAISGIANASAFNSSLDSFCGDIKQVLTFNDHCTYGKNKIKSILNYINKHQAQAIITTKKDLYKIVPYIKNISFFILDVSHDIQQKELDSLFVETVKKHYS